MDIFTFNLWLEHGTCAYMVAVAGLDDPDTAQCAENARNKREQKDQAITMGNIVLMAAESQMSEKPQVELPAGASRLERRRVDACS